MGGEPPLLWTAQGFGAVSVSSGEGEGRFRPHWIHWDFPVAHLSATKAWLTWVWVLACQE